MDIGQALQNGLKEFNNMYGDMDGEECASISLLLGGYLDDIGEHNYSYSGITVYDSECPEYGVELYHTAVKYNGMYYDAVGSCVHSEQEFIDSATDTHIIAVVDNLEAKDHYIGNGDIECYTFTICEEFKSDFYECLDNHLYRYSSNQSEGIS